MKYISGNRQEWDIVYPIPDRPIIQLTVPLM